ncbi:uracil-DNA glycosylase [Acetonema longum]|uniref:uracil-DNA glycosylase n=1 Tax=Acetonema longum TaxID=2374 RepID=UPI0002FA2FDC|nr:uracil-DNA glycosylase [Acetonema longum]
MNLHTELIEKLYQCNLCHLCNEGNLGPTAFNGSMASPIAIVGEGPGETEDQFGVPLIGNSGKLLDKALWSVGITRDRVYTTNIIKCRPKGNRTPTVDEGSFCATRWLDNELAAVKPRIIIALGSVALKYLLNANARITKDRGKWFQTKYGIPAIATYHPAFLLRLTGKELVKAKWETFYDLQAAANRCTEIEPDYLLKSAAPLDLLALYSANKGKQRGISESNVRKENANGNELSHSL